MIADHIKYLKQLIENNITARTGTAHPLNKKFFEIYPKPGKLKQQMPCAALRHLPGKTKKNGSWDSSSVTASVITNTKKLYDRIPVYQVDFFSTDIYDFIEKDNTYTGFLNQFIELVANNESFTAADGRLIGVECGPSGVIDDHSLIVDNVYKAYCQVKFEDGIYKDITVPRITGVNLTEGGMS